MTRELIDISMPLDGNMPVWPGNEPPSIKFPSWFNEGQSVSSIYTSNEHNGTHIDAPLHFNEGGQTVDELPVDLFVGPATVVDCSSVGAITADVLADRVPSNTERLLLRTDNAQRRERLGSDFDSSFVALTTDGARWIVENEIRLVGNDYPSIAVYKGDAEIHRSLMRAGVGILEGVVLDHVAPGDYELICLPLKIVGAEAAQTRAVLRRL